MTRIATASFSKLFAIVALTPLLASAGAAQEASAKAPRPVAYKVRLALTVSGAPIEGAVIVVDGDKIAAIGKASETEIPFGADVVDLGDVVAAPGFVHAASFAFTSARDFDGRGKRDGGERRIADEIAPDRALLDRLAKNGFTTLNIVPPDGGVGGRGCLVRPVPETGRALRPEDVVFERDSCLAMAFAPRTSTKKFWSELLKKVDPKEAEEKSDGAPRSRASSSRPASRPSSGDSESRPTSAPAASKAADPRKDPKLEPLVDVLERKRAGLLHLAGPAALAHFEAILKEHEKFRPTFVLPPDSWAAVDLAAKYAKSVVLSTSASLRPDTYVYRFAPLEFVEKGVAVALIPETSAASAYVDYPFHLAEAARRGLEVDDVLRAATLTPAEILGVSDSIGSLDAGKRADVVFWSQHPLAPSARVVRTLAAGAVVYDESKEP